MTEILHLLLHSPNMYCPVLLSRLWTICCVPFLVIWVQLGWAEVRSRELICISCRVARVQVLGPSAAAFLDESIGSCIKNRAVGTGTSTHMLWVSDVNPLHNTISDNVKEWWIKGWIYYLLLFVSSSLPPANPLTILFYVCCFFVALNPRDKIRFYLS